MSSARHAASLLVLGVFLVFNVATSKSRSSSGTPGPTPVPAPTPIVATERTQADLDPSAAKSTLGCSGAKSDGCRVLDEFATASKLDESPAAGTTKVWMGRTYAVGGPANGKTQYFFLQVRQGSVPADPSIAKASVLPVVGTARWLRPDSASEERASAALLAAVKSGKSAPAGNAAAAYVKKPAEDAVWRAMLQSSGTSTVIFKAGEHPTYVRKSGDHVLVIEYADGALLDNAKGWCAEAWPLK